MDQLRFQALSGPAIAPVVDALAGLRIRVFREWPYLYDGDLDYERAYLDTYVRSARSLAFLVYHGDALVGATTALPLADEEAAFWQPLEAAGFQPDTLCYFGESLLLPAYRGRGLGHRFFDEREAHARAQGFSVACFCAVQRPPDHPRRPEDFRPLDGFWRQRGYAPRADIVARYRWRDLGEEAESEKPLMFWLRDLASDFHHRADRR